ncbi:MAG: beta-ketoacyl-[acyl-carrier-protein] synthase family protein [Lachnospiraceae bacterium]|nr:beta-ketoacyl-[acyl-carrier-protein] synthase family protein [Robinsoniella sp.]MDY3767840.1 beta-ketoacyl-[acyl-carrier-protein] synthase family protein [Lachnospiraceae bacterium]
MKRVVITGYGAINALGKNKTEIERRLFGGESGLSQKIFPSKDQNFTATVGKVDKLEQEDPFFRDHNLPKDRCVEMALLAAGECLEHAKITYEREDCYRRGVAIGTSLGGMLSGQEFHRQWRSKGIAQADGRYLYLYPLHAIVDVIAKKFHFKGAKCVISTACAASGNVIGYGADLIKSGRYDLMLAGGADPLSTFSFAGFHALKALDNEPCKPYSDSHGINLGEGAAFLLLEEYEHARKRNAHIFAEVAGYGLSADAYHPTAPDLGGGGAARAMAAALENSGIAPEKVSYVNGHGTGTVANDQAESMAFRTVFGKRLAEVPLSSIKGAIGHCLGAAGAEEAVASVMALERGQLPPTVNFKKIQHQPQINFVPEKAQEKESRVILSNSFAFGGNNCCVAFSVPEVERRERERAKTDIVITGMGCCGVGGENLAELWDTFAERKVWIGSFESRECSCRQIGIMPKVEWKKYISGKYIRRIDEITKMALVSGKYALDAGKITVTRENMEKIGVIYATATGPLGTIVSIDRTIIEEGIGQISLSEFPNSVINAAPGNFCIANMLKGPTSTLSEGICSFLPALNYACEILKNKMADIMVVISADECNEPLLVGKDKLGLLSAKSYQPLTNQSDGMVMSQGSVAVLLETEEHAKEREAPIYAAIKGYSATSDNEGIATVSTSGEELAECVRRAVEESGIKKIDLYVNAALGVSTCDEADCNAIERLKEHGIFDAQTRYSAVSPLLGVASGTNSGYGLLSILYSFERQEVIGFPKQISLRDSVDEGYAKGKNIAVPLARACLSGMSLGGTYGAVVVQKYEEKEK